MKTQKYNEGELASLNIQIDKKIVENLDIMSRNSGISKEDIVVIALKRYESSHADYMKVVPELD